LGGALGCHNGIFSFERVATGTQGVLAPRCADAGKPATPPYRPSAIAVIYVHATAVNHLIGRNAAVELGQLPVFLIAPAIAALAAIAARLLRPVTAASAYIVITGLGAAVATVAFDRALVLPIVAPFIAGLTA